MSLSREAEALLLAVSNKELSALWVELEDAGFWNEFIGITDAGRDYLAEDEVVAEGEIWVDGISEIRIGKHKRDDPSVEDYLYDYEGQHVQLIIRRVSE